MKLVVLYVEDEPNDVFFFKRTMAAAAPEFTTYCVPDGDIAVEWIFGRGKFSDHQQFPRPDVVVMDLKLPRMHGFEVLKAVKAEPRFASIPVIVYSSSLQEKDITTALSHGAWSFIGKNADCSALLQELRVIAASRSFIPDLARPRFQVFA
jgi:two-component system, response regulator